MNTKTLYSPEVRERAVRLFFSTLHDHPSRWAAIQSVSSKIGCTAETLRRWIKRTEIDQGSRDGITTDQNSGQFICYRTGPDRVRSRC